MSEEKQKAVGIDLNNLPFEPESLEIDPDKDQFAAPPPVEEGTFLAKLSQKEVNGSLWVRGESKKHKRYLQTAIEARIIQVEGKYDNWPVFDNFVSTMVMENQGTNKIVGILKALGHEVPRTTNDVDLAKKLTEVLAGNPICKITVGWEGYCEVCDKTVLKGQKRWPAGRHVTECPKDGATVTAQPRVLKYLPAEAA